MMLDKKSLELFHWILSTQPNSTPFILNAKSITSRQLFYHLDKINDWLELNGLPKLITNQSEFEIPFEVLTYWQQHQDLLIKNYNFNRNERALLILLFTFIRTEEISNAHYQFFLNVSKNTITKDIKQANELGKSFRVRVKYTREQGFHLKGQEEDKRNLIFKCISLFSSHPKRNEILSFLFTAHNHKDLYDNYEKKLHLLAKQYNLTFIEGRMFEFIYLLQMIHIRQQQQKLIQIYAGTIEFLSKHPMFEAAAAIQEELGDCRLEEETIYLTMLLLGITMGTTPTSSATILTDVTKKMIHDFQRYACIQFKDQKKAYESLYSHFQPAYYRMLYKIPITNPLLKEIKSEHNTIFQIVSEVMHPIEEMLNIDIPEDEIGFLTLHFGALLEKESLVINRPYRAVIVCPNGISSSLMMETYLKSSFPGFQWITSISKEEFSHITEERFDLVFSTIPLNTKKPLFIVKPILNELEKKHLIHSVYQQLSKQPATYPTPEQIIRVVEKHANIRDKRMLEDALTALLYGESVASKVRGKQPMLNEILTKEMIQFKDRVPDWKTAIAYSAEPLLQQGYITQEYINKMIQNVEEIGPYIVIHPGIAIPHARPEFGVKKLGMSFLKLKEPTYILNQEKNRVQLLICLAAIDNSTHLKALAQLTKLLGNKKSLQQLMHAETTEEVMSLINQYSIEK